jgi:hypothetical protein
LTAARAALVALPLVALLACGGDSMPMAPDKSTAFAYNGLTHVSWWHDQYLGSDASDARAGLAATGANWAGVLVTWYMDRRDSSFMAPDALRTPSDAAVLRAIEELRGLGLKVMLKPHVDVKDGTWRGSIRPSDTHAWFTSYAEFIVHYAALAQTAGVELLCVGTELATLSDARHRGDWEMLVAAVRSSYGGRLTYAANATSPADEFTSVSFWDQLDLGGLDAYAPLTDRAQPSRAELSQGWVRNRYGQNMVAAFRNWQASHGKPVIFTEIGYRSADGANRAPWDFSSAGSYDPQEQADCYAAALEVWSRESAWMQGLFWWNWPVPVPALGDVDYTPRGKPAEDVLRLWHRSG